MHPMTTQLPVLLRWLIQTTWQAAVLVCVILFVQFLFGKKLSPAWRYALWVLVVVRLLLPTTPKTTFSLFNVAHAGTVQSLPVIGSIDAGRRTADAGLVADAPGKRPSDAAAPDAPPSPLSIRGILTGAWLAVVLLLLARVMYKNFAFSSRVVRRRPVTDKTILDLLQDCKTEMHVHVPMDIVETQNVKSPSLLGFVRPRLLLPEGMLQSFPREPLRYFFLHELAHFKRGDIFVNWLASILQILHWFNPFVWVAFGRMRIAREEACDACVVSVCADANAGREYAAAIVDLLAFSARVHWLPGVVGILEDKKYMKRRITMIASFRKYSAWSAVLAASVLVVLGLTVLTDAQSPAPSQDSELHEYLAALNLGFEDGQKADRPWPPVWGGGGEGFELIADDQVQHGGGWSGRIRSNQAEQSGFGTLTGALDPSRFAGKRVRYSGYMKLADVTGFAGLWMRADASGKVLAFDNMSGRKIDGTRDWEQYSLELDIPTNADNINFGVLLGNGGTLWADDLSIEIIGDAVEPQPKAAFSTNGFDMAGWFKAGSEPDNYKIGTDTEIVRPGRSQSAFLAFSAGDDNTPEGFGTLMKYLYAIGTFKGKRIQMTAYVKCEGVTDWAGLWMRVDGKQEGPLAFDNMVNRPIEGTTEWKAYTIVLPVPKESTGIGLGVLLTGKGRVWIDQVEFKEADETAETTDFKSLQDKKD